ncbi:uncharacterized protein LOC62_06G008725 [Vanrija pseudolonga]|uniref:Stress-associated endoplasmic reticulum protein n=1 Tax=Vanrija pseudolonga TaxID=143232 RepID=A0AAF0YEF4_9TREE|nr:hypothetical protein LOC62_06G008725 [Vanrija pseudolonga]
MVNIKRKNANFAARAQAGKKTTRPSKTLQKRSATKWLVGTMLFLVVGGTVVELLRLIFLGTL